MKTSNNQVEKTQVNKGGSDTLSIMIPKEVENLQLPNPELLNFFKNLEDRIIWIDTDIDDYLLEQVKQILIWNKEDKDTPLENRKKIKMFIFSYGGTLDSCFTMIDVCKLSKTPIVTFNMGIAMSAGLLLLLCGDERYSLQKSQALIHSGSGGSGGTYEQQVAQMSTYTKLVEMMRDYIIERTKIDKKLFNSKKAKDWYIFAEEQVSLGIVNGIVDNIDMLY